MENLIIVATDDIVYVAPRDKAQEVKRIVEKLKKSDKSKLQKMKKEETLFELESLAEKLGIEIRYEKGDFQGDQCILHEEGVIVIHKKATVERKVTVISRGLSRLDLGNTFVLPESRALIEPVHTGEQLTIDDDEDKSDAS